jgi:HlyD family secretion protein
LQANQAYGNLYLHDSDGFSSTNLRFEPEGRLSDSIFRKDALDRMASPDRLDMPVRLVPTSGWLLLGAFALLITAALIWATLSTAPIRVAGEGILIDSAGLSEVSASIDGQIEAMRVVSGQSVSRGQVIALLRKSEISRASAEIASRLDAARARLASLSALYLTENNRMDSAALARLGSIAASRMELVRRTAILQKRRAGVARLAQQGFVRSDDILAAEVAIAEAKERVADLDAEAAKIRIDGIKSSGANDIALIDARHAVEELERQQVRLAEELTEQTSVRAIDAGRIVELQAAPGDVVSAGSGIATVARSGARGSLIAIIYVPAGAGKRIRPGMSARIEPRTIERSAYGEMSGHVLTVAALPATRDGMRQTLRNDALVDQLLGAGAVVEIRVRLDRDRTTPSGFAWTTAKGPDTSIEAGTLADGAITVERKRILAWLLPGDR